MKRRVHQWLGVGLAAILVALALSGCTAPAMPAAPAGDSQEGIEVHGAWTLEVVNSDGTVAERREFENAIVDLGKESLARFLGRQDSIGLWRICLVGDAFLDPTASPNSGVVEEPEDPWTFSNGFKNLIVTVSGDTVALSGTAVAQRVGSIWQVSTQLSRSSGELPPGDPSGGFYDFTATNLDSPVGLSTGQQVAVTVVISFS